MSSTVSIPTLADLDLQPYFNAEGLFPSHYEGKIGVFAIYSDTQVLQYVGYSRNVLLSLKQHLVRRPQDCHGFKVFTIERPSRTLLGDIQTAWLAEQSTPPVGNGDQQDLWEQDIDVKAVMTPEEIAQSQDPTLEEKTRIKVVKQAARRVEGEIRDILSARGLQDALFFNPKLKETGLLTLKK